MNSPEEIELLKTGSIVDFEIIESIVNPCVGEEEANSVAKLMMVDDNEKDGYDSVEWGSFGFIYLLACLSFNDARPRGSTEIYYVKDDYFTIGDLISNLSFANGKLVLYCDYLRGRLVKTNISIQSNGLVEIQTTLRGNALSTWLNKLKGKKNLQVVN